MADRKRMLRGFAILVAVYLVVVFAIPKPAAVKPGRLEADRCIFAATIVGSIIEPIPAGALVLLAVTLSAVMGGLTITEALSGYSNSSVWLVLVAFFISRALIQTGLARRIALFFVRSFGHSSLGVAYSLAASDMVLAGMIPSNGARSAGVVLPIVRSIAELYGSHPGETAERLGAHLMAAVYQAVCVTSAMFITGQVSNFIARDSAHQVGYEISPAGWIRATIVLGTSLDGSSAMADYARHPAHHPEDARSAPVRGRGAHQDGLHGETGRMDSHCGVRHGVLFLGDVAHFVGCRYHGYGFARLHGVAADRRAHLG